MRILGCCRARHNEAPAKEANPSSVENVKRSPEYSQKFCMAVKLVLKDTVEGAVLGGMLVAYSSNHMCFYKAQCAEDIFNKVQVEINNKTTCYNETTSYHENDWIRDRVMVTTVLGGIVGAVIGGSIGAYSGVMRICGALLCQKTMKHD